jgi:hypothetical protein
LPSVGGRRRWCVPFFTKLVTLHNYFPSVYVLSPVFPRRSPTRLRQSLKALRTAMIEQAITLMNLSDRLLPRAYTCWAEAPVVSCTDFHLCKLFVGVVLRSLENWRFHLPPVRELQIIAAIASKRGSCGLPQLRSFTSLFNPIRNKIGLACRYRVLCLVVNLSMLFDISRFLAHNEFVRTAFVAFAIV